MKNPTREPLATTSKSRVSMPGAPAKSSLVFWGFLACLVGLTWLRIDLPKAGGSLVKTANAMPSAPAEEEGVVIPLNTGPAAAVTVAVTADTVTAAAVVERVIEDTLGRAGSIYLSLKQHKVPELQIARLGNALQVVFDAKKSRPDDAFSLTLDSANVVVRFEYTPAQRPEYPILVEREGDRLVARQSKRPLIDINQVLRVVIKDNLSNAIRDVGESDALTDIVADDIFAAIIDFQTDPREGDELELIVVKSYLDDRFIRYKEVRLARYRGQVANHTGVLYSDLEGRDGYYDEGGQSLTRIFLLKPMDYRRISSRFSRRRFHPILKRNVPHLGTDYAANQGTRVHTTARGRVTHAGWNGGYGKMVEVSHPNGYRTRYAHLSQIHVRKGQSVEQKDVIGRVGATGRATGPHLHYELIRNGRHIDPTIVNKSGRGDPLGPQSLPAFAVHRDRLLAQLPAAKAEETIQLADVSAVGP